MQSVMMDQQNVLTAGDGCGDSAERGDLNINNLLLLQFVLLLLKKKDLATSKKRRPRCRPRRFGIRPIFLLRKEQGFYHNLFKDARLGDPHMFFNFTRMSPSSFDKLLSIVGPSLLKTSMRESISPGCRLAITLRFLATGDSYPSLSYAFRVGTTTICNIVRETCHVLSEKMQPLVLPTPSVEDLEEIANVFGERWSLPNCVGAIDGKHITIQAPSNSGSSYFNYKKKFSTVLLAVCDGNYLFTYVDIGAYGSESDSGVLHQSNSGKNLLNNNLNLPPANKLPFCPSKRKIPYFFVGDEAFPFKQNLMRPYSKPRNGNLDRDARIFNYRLSRARRIIENTFGIMVARFRILHRVINGLPTTVDSIMKAVVCLHNFIRKENNSFYINEADFDREVAGKMVPGRWRGEIPRDGALQNIPHRIGARNAAFSALEIRDFLKEYLCGPGACLAPWQWEIIDRTN